MGYKTSHERMIIVQEYLTLTGLQPTASGLHVTPRVAKCGPRPLCKLCIYYKNLIII